MLYIALAKLMTGTDTPVSSAGLRPGIGVQRGQTFFRSRMDAWFCYVIGTTWLIAAFDPATGFSVTPPMEFRSNPDRASRYFAGVDHISALV